MFNNMKKEYLVIFVKSANSVGAHVPDLPGCVSVGADFEECRRNIAEAMEFHLEGIIADGEQLPEPTGYRADMVGVSVVEPVA